MFDFFSKPAVCAYNHPLRNKFKYVIDPHSIKGEQFDPKKTLCKDHFISDWMKFIQTNMSSIVFTEPIDDEKGVQKYSQSAYYAPDELKIDGFSKEDEEEIVKLLKHANNKTPVVWLPKHVAAEITSPPLIKVRDLFELITFDDLERRVKNVFSKYDLLDKGEFKVNLPNDIKQGLFLYTNYL